MVPAISRVGVLLLVAGSANSMRSFSLLETAGQTFKIQVEIPLEVATLQTFNLDGTFREADEETRKWAHLLPLEATSWYVYGNGSPSSRRKASPAVNGRGE